MKDPGDDLGILGVADVVQEGGGGGMGHLADFLRIQASIELGQQGGVQLAGTGETSRA